MIQPTTRKFDFALCKQKPPLEESIEHFIQISSSDDIIMAKVVAFNNRKKTIKVQFLNSIDSEKSGELVFDDDYDDFSYHSTDLAWLKVIKT